MDKIKKKLKMPVGLNNEKLNIVNQDQPQPTQLAKEEGREEFELLYEEYMVKCSEGNLTEEERKEYLKKFADLIDEKEEEVKSLKQKNKDNPSKENRKMYSFAKEQLKEYKQKLRNLPDDCSKNEDTSDDSLENNDHNIESPDGDNNEGEDVDEDDDENTEENEEKDYELIQIVFMDYPDTGDYHLHVPASGGDRIVEPGLRPGREKSIESNLPEELFERWTKLEILGAKEWHNGEFGLLKTISGSNTTRKITIRLEGRAGNYGENFESFGATFYPDLEAKSRPIVLKLPNNGKRWEEAVWDYKLKGDEKIEKTLTKPWSGKFGNKYRKYNP